MACQIEGRDTFLRVCFTPDTAFYRYGPLKSEPELEISEPVATLDYRPWPGAGRSIFEDVIFTNEGYRYGVFAGIDRMFDDETEDDHPTPRFGGVSVKRGEDTLADLACDRATVDFDWGEELFEAKQALGYSWDPVDRMWVELPD